MQARVEVRIARADLKRWRVTAAASGLSLSEWMRRRCNNSAFDADTVARIAGAKKPRRR